MLQRVGFPVAGQDVEGILHLPEGETVGGLVVLGGRGHDLSGPNYLCDALAAAGLAALRFTYRSPDDFASALPEVAGAVRLLRAHPEVPQRTGVVGHSYGAAAAAVAAGRDSRLRAAVLIAPPAERDYFGALRPLAELSRTRARVLIVAPGADTVVPPDHAARYADVLSQARVRHRLVVVEGADHELSEPEHRATLLTELLAWCREALAA